MAAPEEVTYFVVNNIPGRFRSADLRNYFSQFIESGGFACFHYRHRPELRVTSGACEAGEGEARPAAPADGKQWSSCCCVVSVRAQESDRFIRMYSGNQWIDSSGNWLRNTCLIRRVRVSEQSDCDLFPYKTKAELRRHVAQSEQFTESDLRGLPELNPPALMPSGNVGTPVSVFLQLIQSCRLPPRLIRKLGLTFPKTGSNRRYGNVPYQYHNTRVVTPAEESVFTAGGVEIKGHAQRDTPTTSHRKQGKPTTLYRTQETPTASQAKQDTPTISLTIQDTPTTTQTNQDTPSTSCIIQDTPTASQRQQDTPTASQKLDMSTTSCKIQDTPTASQRKQDTPTTSCIIQDTPTTSQTVQDTPTTSQKQDMFTTSCKIQDTPSASQRKDTPPTSCIIQDTPTASQRKDMPPTSCIIQDTPTTSQTKRLNTPTASRKIQDTPTCTQTLYEDTPSPPVNQPSQEEESEEELSGPDDDDDRCEEWERHEALHEDITAQERSKERLFEEEIELKWEKGGSGLVFYTDAQFWQEEEEGDFDEQTADDWDVDMSVYYDKDGGDMDSRAYVRMRSEQRLRDGLTNTHIGSFERFTKGVGRRLMEKQGWRDGEGLGNSQMGMAEALENEGQHPHCKRGFGYHGEKLNSFLPAKKPRKDFHISTVYDEPRDIDQGDDLLRRQPNTSMKYRQRRMNNNPNR